MNLESNKAYAESSLQAALDRLDLNTTSQIETYDLKRAIEETEEALESIKEMISLIEEDNQ